MPELQIGAIEGKSVPLCWSKSSTPSGLHGRSGGPNVVLPAVCMLRTNSTSRSIGQHLNNAPSNAARSALKAAIAIHSELAAVDLFEFHKIVLVSQTPWSLATSGERHL
jgi:hypothetical protein